jgi:hypothetical protein
MLGNASGQTPGAIYELLSRGTKDKYFISEPEEGAFTPFANQYSRTARHIKETKAILAVNEPSFGQTIEFSLERYGDILTDMWLEIQLPSWVPQSAYDAHGPQEYVDATTGAKYEYQPAAGFFAFKKIEILQGQMTILETSGDALYLLSGVHRRGAAADLARHLGEPNPAAHSSPLRVKVPFPGCQSDRDGSFPLCAVPDKQYKIRVTLRPLADLISWSSWPTTLRGVRTGHIVSAVKEYNMTKPRVVLEVTQAYITRDARDEILKTAATLADGILIPYITHFEQLFPLKTSGSQPLLIDNIQNLCEGLYIYARDNNASRLIDISRGAISEIGFTIAGRDREFRWNSDVLVDVMGHAKTMSPTPVDGLFMLNWSLGDVHRPISQDPMKRRPEGVVNFTEVDKPVLYVTPGSGVQNNSTSVYVIGESWRAYNIRDGGYGRIL